MTSKRRFLKQLTCVTVWSTPVIQTVVLPAHAQTSPPTTIFEYFAENRHDGGGSGGGGPRDISVLVDTVANTAEVMANSSQRNVLVSVTLSLDGTPSNAFINAPGPCAFPDAGPFTAMWNVEGYTAGDPTISIVSSGGTGMWTAVVPLGTGTLPALCV